MFLIGDIHWIVVRFTSRTTQSSSPRVLETKSHRSAAPGGVVASVVLRRPGNDHTTRLTARSQFVVRGRSAGVTRHARVRLGVLVSARGQDHPSTDHPHTPRAWVPFPAPLGKMSVSLIRRGHTRTHHSVRSLLPARAAFATHGPCKCVLRFETFAQSASRSASRACR